MGIAHSPAAPESATEQAGSAHGTHQAVVTAAIFSALVGQFHHHFPDVDLPEALAVADGAAFGDATMLLDLAGPAGAHYDLATITQVAFESGRTHAGGECVFCADDELEQLVDSALAHGRALAAAAAG